MTSDPVTSDPAYQPAHAVKPPPRALVLLRRAIANTALIAVVALAALVAPALAASPPTWTVLSPATSPSARAFSAMGYDAALTQVVLFGGLNATTGSLSDTWTWNGAAWVERFPARFRGPATAKRWALTLRLARC